MQAFSIGSLVLLHEYPDAGPFRVQGHANDALIVRRDWGGDALNINPQIAGAVPYPYWEGQPVLLVHGSDNGVEGQVLSAVTGVDGLRTLSVLTLNGTVEVSEADISIPEPDATDPIALFQALTWRGPRRYFARQGMWEQVSGWYEFADGIPSMLGARIRLMGHQLYAALRVLWDASPRFVLADEVGLGKTIEAGLITQALASAKPEMSILIIAPGAMTRQWLCEMWLRFGARAFSTLDSARLASLRRAEREKVLNHPRLLVSVTALAEDLGLQQVLARRSWDLVIVDEAHQFPANHPLFPFLQTLAKQSDGFLALSATPSKRETEGMLALLSLVSPEVYDPKDAAGLDTRLEGKRAIWKALAISRQLQQETALSKEVLNQGDLQFIAKRWKNVAAEDPIVQELVTTMASGGEGALDELIAYVQEFHRVDHRLIRTRRATLAKLGSQFSERQVLRIDYESSAAERILTDHLNLLGRDSSVTLAQLALCGIYRRAFTQSPYDFRDAVMDRQDALDNLEPASLGRDLVAGLLSDPGPEEETTIIEALIASTPAFAGECDWLRTAIDLANGWIDSTRGYSERHRATEDWVASHLEEDPTRKVLVFAQDLRVVEAVAKRLQDRFGEGAVAKFHYEMKDADLTDAAQRFQRSTDCRVLVSDELGGEGRNFQMASALVHLDQPWSISRLEQRIGRLDRIGRSADHPVLSVIMVGPDRTEQALATLHDDVVGVYRRSVGGMEFALPRIQRDVTLAAWRGSDALTELMPALRTVIGAALAQTDEEFELALDSSRVDLERAGELASVLAVKPPLDGDILKSWARALEMNWKELPDDSIDVSWQTNKLAQPLNGFQDHGEGRYAYHGTTSRKLALRDEAVQFFAPGHRIVDAMVDALQHGSVGRVTVFKRDLGTEHKNRLYLVMSGRCRLDLASLDGTDMPAGLMARAYRRLWPEVAMHAVALHSKGEELATSVPPGSLLRSLCQPWEGQRQEPNLTPAKLAGLNPDFHRIAEVVGAGSDLGMEILLKDRRVMAGEAADSLQDDLRHELGFLRGQVARGGNDAHKALDGIRLRERLVDAVRNERVVLDAMAIVIGK
jgi:superfamily II DNA or RNA helicase